MAIQRSGANIQSAALICQFNITKSAFVVVVRSNGGLSVFPTDGNLMRLLEQLKQKPVETSSAVAMIVLGIVLGALLEGRTWPAIGGAIAALGGALLSYSTSNVDSHSKARDLLRPELQVASRHLADIAGKISRAVQAALTKAITPEMAIDRISQLTSTLYGTVNDLNLIGGENASFDNVVETVTVCEQMAAELERLTAVVTPSDETGPQFHQQIESLRLQLATAVRSIANPTEARQKVVVDCPKCNHQVETQLGVTSGDSSFGDCTECGERFHVHRGADGRVFTRQWGAAQGGGTPPIRRIIATCTKCQQSVPLNFHVDSKEEKRYCMNCCAELTVSSDGSVTDTRESAPIQAADVSFINNRIQLECSERHQVLPSIWRSDSVYRAVCKNCSKLVEAPVSQDDAG